MHNFIETIKEDLIHDEYQVREQANLCLLSYDLGRAKTDKERENAGKEYDYRNWAFVIGYGLKETQKVVRRCR